MKKLSLLFVFAAMFAFVSCGPAADKKAEDVQNEVIENLETEIDTLQQDVEEGVEAIEEKIEEEVK
ncbi:MAG: hypothetical protein PHD06_01725 [Bacteroidales bacterium]|jgi:hypothetical protein|nr:hypothetical protein [Bacteroidales bacterium]MDD4383878.1 hypothetical protein [Bacteroidales bacterium]MDY0196457.1 hypothetical protein [Tenuifilaceae bacterium]